MSDRRPTESDLAAQALADALSAQADEPIDPTAAELNADFESADLDGTGDLPSAGTESYGTGVHDQPGFAAGGGTLRDRLSDMNAASPKLTGGDIDANFEQAYAVGDEAVGGTAPTPDMDVVDELGAAVGLEMDDRAFLRTAEILESRDDRRWDLDPASAEDYDDRRE